MVDELKKQIEDVSKVHPSLLSEAKDNNNFLDNSIDQGFVNKIGSSISLRENGDIALSSSLTSQYKITKDGIASETSVQSHTQTVRKTLEVDEIVINKHKLNPDIYELTDMRECSYNPNVAIGNLTMFGTVLVKAWEPTLKKWVLIRRQVRMPLFSPTLNLSNVPNELSINSDISSEIEDITGGR